MYRLNYKCLLSFASKKYYSNCVYNENFTVNSFHSLFITCPFNVKIRPLDIHKYPNCDQLIISLFCNKSKSKANVTCMEDNNKFSIFGYSSGTEDVDCYIETPIKSDINVVTTQTGKIDIKKMNGEKIILRSESGDIISNSCVTSKVNFASKKGNITTTGTLHAGEIILNTEQSGKIDVNHLQALNASVITENGDIKIKSSYCDNTAIQTNTGKLILDNMHKNCSIMILENGLLQMTGFDGTLNAKIMEGDVDIQISKLYDQSNILAKKKTSILLRLSEWVQENTLIKTDCEQLKVADDVILFVKNENNCAVLTPKHTKYTSELEINTKLSKIAIEGASWSDMLKLKGIKFVD